MDWENLQPDEYRLLSRHYNSGRSENIRGIVLHHNAGTLSGADCYNVWQTREASAHYQVDINGYITQLVNDWDTAWHAGSANPWSIGIEHANDNSDPWTISDATLEAGAHLVAALCKGYNLGRPEWGVNVFGHSDFMSTACPGEIAGSQNAAYMARAQTWYDAMTGGETPAPYEGGGDSQPSQPGNVEEIRYAAMVNGEWLPDMVGHSDTGGSSDTWAGNGQPIEYLAIEMPGWYQVETDNGWLDKIYKFDKGDLVNGAAGDGSPIHRVRCWYETQNPDATGYHQIEYSIANVDEDFLPNMVDLTDTGGSSDDFAGNGGTVARFRARIVQQ